MHTYFGQTDAHGALFDETYSTISAHYQEALKKHLARELKYIDPINVDQIIEVSRFLKHIHSDKDRKAKAMSFLKNETIIESKNADTFVSNAIEALTYDPKKADQDELANKVNRLVEWGRGEGFEINAITYLQYCLNGFQAKWSMQTRNVALCGGVGTPMKTNISRT